MSISIPPKIDLGFFPTPIAELPQLSALLGGPRILMKRDDQTGLALGGNKTRKLEFIVQDAISQGCDTLITAGATQSNHCRQTAAAAAQQQLECHLVLGGSAPQTPNGNLLLDDLLGAHIHWAGENRKGEDIPKIAAQLKSEGKKPYLVPYGGSSELGAYSFIHALQEIEAQLIEKPTHIVFASSSGGTHAGLMLGKALLRAPYQIIGINIDKGETGKISFAEHILNLSNQTAHMIGTDITLSQNDLILDDRFVGKGYGVVGELEREAIKLTAQHEGILLDPVYTGRAMGGLIHMIRAKEFTANDTVLFWHTGGAPALFNYADKFNLGADPDN